MTNTSLYCIITIIFLTRNKYKKYKGVKVMKKQELVAAIAKKSGLSKPDAAKALKATTETITEALAMGETISLVGFGTFKTKKRAERTAKNPRTGEAIKVAAATVASFKVGKALKDSVNK